MHDTLPRAEKNRARNPHIRLFVVAFHRALLAQGCLSPHNRTRSQPFGSVAWQHSKKTTFRGCLHSAEGGCRKKLGCTGRKQQQCASSSAATACAEV